MTHLTETESPFIPLSVPEVRGHAWTYVKDCLDTGWVSSVGSYVDRFEQAVADFVDAEHAVATVNGTAALHVALLVAGVEPNDEVLMPTVTFIAPANAVRYCGAWPVFMDAESQFWQMDPEKVANFLDRECTWRDGALWNRSTNRRVRAIMPVHILGHPSDMSPLLDVARRYDLVVIEDASESLGARYRGQHTGTLGDIGCFSFNGNKIVTTGGGGMIVTGCADWAARAKHLTTQAKSDPIEYIHDEIGYNYRLVNVLAALGCAQMEDLSEFIDTKRTIATRYRRAFEDLDTLSCMQVADWAKSIEWLFTVCLKPGASHSRQTLVAELAARQIQARPLWQPIHCLPMYAQSQAYQIEVANQLYEGCASLPCSVSLTEADQQRVIEAVQALLTKG